MSDEHREPRGRPHREGGRRGSSFIAHRSSLVSAQPDPTSEHPAKQRAPPFQRLTAGTSTALERVMLRRILRHPGRSLLTILTLALGLGATTAVVSAIYSVLLAPLPYPHPEQLVVVSESMSDEDGFGTVGLHDVR
jgi:hypothetical protein